MKTNAALTVSEAQARNHFRTRSSAGSGDAGALHAFSEFSSRTVRLTLSRIPALLVLAAASALLIALPPANASAPAARPAYETEIWPDAPTLVWARPGESGAYGDPKNWLENGEPATQAPDRNTDVVLPPAAQRYVVSAKPFDEVRHLTVGMHAHIQGRHRNDLQVWGNVWVKDGGSVQFIAVRGPKHTFFRMDNAEFPTVENGLTFLGGMPRFPSTQPQSRARVSHKFEIAKFGEASVEFIGNIGVGDEIMVQHGRVIISGDLRWSGVTDKGAIEVFDGAVLELQSGGSIAPFISTNGKDVYNVNVYRGGTLQAGSPQRPLTSDAYIRLGYGTNNERPGQSGLYSALGSVIRVYSSDPEKARLVFTSITSTPGFHDGHGNLVAAPDTPARGREGIVLDLAGDVNLNGAFFDYVSEGGIRLLDPKMRTRWENVAFGRHNAGLPVALFGGLEVDADVYYHDRRDGLSEFRLTKTARMSMEAYMQQHDPYQISISPEPVEVREEGVDPLRGGRTFAKPFSVIFTEPVEVTITTQIPDAAIHYTTDGSAVSPESPRYIAPLRLDRTTRLNIRAYAEGKPPSPPVTVTYVFDNNQP